MKKLGVLALALTAACGATVVADDGGPGGGAVGGAGAGGGAECAIDAPGTSFSIIVRNVGMRTMNLFYGCGTDYPIRLETPNGSLGIGPETADFCGVDCANVYAGESNIGCSDCGPGYFGDLAPGSEQTIRWDRRIYTTHVAPAECSGHPDGNNCALGTILPVGVYSGQLTVCTTPELGTFGCGGPEPVPFQLDLATDSLVIEVQ